MSTIEIKNVSVVFIHSSTWPMPIVWLTVLNWKQKKGSTRFPPAIYQSSN